MWYGVGVLVGSWKQPMACIAVFREQCSASVTVHLHAYVVGTLCMETGILNMAAELSKTLVRNF